MSDAKLTERALKSARISCSLNVVRDAEQALKFLNREEPYGHAEEPDLILLDLKLPKVSGRQLLKELKSHDDFRRIPVIVLTTSSNPRDIVDCYDMGANSFITKPVEYTEFEQVVKTISSYWFGIAKLPEPGPETESPS